MTALQWAALAGTTTGLGATLIVAGLAPGRPDLATTLARLDGSPLASPQDRTAGSVLAGWLFRPGRLTPPTADLAVVGRSAEQHALRKALMGGYGLALPAVLSTLLALAGVGVPFVVPVFASLALAGLFFLAPDLVLRGEAEDLRSAFRRDIGAYLDLVALERAADGGPADALHRAASVGGSRTFLVLGDTLRRSQLAGTAPWIALTELAEQVGVTELRDLADIVAMAGDDGAAVYGTLVAKAAAMRARALSDAEAAANAASERMTLPAVLLGFAFLLLVCYPALARVLS